MTASIRAGLARRGQVLVDRDVELPAHLLTSCTEAGGGRPDSGSQLPPAAVMPVGEPPPDGVMDRRRVDHDARGRQVDRRARRSRHVDRRWSSNHDRRGAKDHLGTVPGVGEGIGGRADEQGTKNSEGSEQLGGQHAEPPSFWQDHVAAHVPATPAWGHSDGKRSAGGFQAV